MIIDEHIHLGGLFQNTDYFIKCMDEAGIDSVLATPYMFEDKNTPRVLKMKGIPPWLAGTRFASNLIKKTMRSHKMRRRYIEKPPNAYVADMVEKYPDRIYGVYWINPNCENTKEIERYLQNPGFVGLKLHQVLYPCDLTGAKFSFFDIAAEYKVPVFIHVDNKNEVRTIMKHMNKTPDLKVILAHMDYYEEIAEEITDFPNLYLDISPLYAHKNSKIEHAVMHLGANRVLFGSDSPCPGSIKYAINRVKKFKISDIDKEKILGSNILNLIKQKVVTSGMQKV